MPQLYMSELQQFLTEFDKKHPERSDSQLAVAKKYGRVFKLRDDPDARKKEKNKLCEDF